MSESGGRPANGRNQPEGVRTPPPGRLPPLPIAAEPNRYALGDLERETGVAGRTIRYYISEGLLPPAYGRGPGATYDLGHLARLQMIQTLKIQHLPLADIRQRLADLSDNEILALLNIQASPVEDTWRRIELHPDIELHVRTRTSNARTLERAADLIVGLARPVIERMEAGE